jgi:sortase A
MHKKIGLLLLICGLLLILKPLAEHGYTYYQQLQLKNELKQTEDIKDSMADNHQIKPPFLLEIPSISVEAVVVEGVEDKDVRRGPGWDPRGVYPGMEGKLIIAAHNNVYGSYFKDLHKLKAGDMVYIASTKESNHKLAYRVKKQNTIDVSDSAAIFSPTKDHILTLITCTSPSDSKKRVVVTAQQINS